MSERDTKQAGDVYCLRTVATTMGDTCAATHVVYFFFISSFREKTEVGIWLQGIEDG